LKSSLKVAFGMFYKVWWERTIIYEL